MDDKIILCENCGIEPAATVEDEMNLCIACLEHFYNCGGGHF